MRAALRLGLNQTTCARRIAALEAALGIALFERTAMGYQPTDSARALRPAAEALEACADQFAQAAACEARSVRRTIRLTVSAHFAGPVAAAVARLRAEAPGVLVEIDSTDVVRDLVAGEADLAIRGGQRPQQEGLVVRRLYRETAGLYCTRDYAERHGTPKTAADLSSHALALMPGPALDLLRAAKLDASLGQVVNSIDGLVAALRSGAFCGFLTDTIAAPFDDLSLCFTAPEYELGAWLVFPERWQGDPAHRRLRELLAEALARRENGG